MKKWNTRRMNADGNGGGHTDPNTTSAPNATNQQANEATFNQAQVDAIVAQRLAADRKRREGETLTQTQVADMIATELGKINNAQPVQATQVPAAQPDPNVEAAKTAREEAEKMLAEANSKLALASFQTLAGKQGLPSEAIDVLAKIVDLSGIQIDNGIADTKAVGEILTQTLEQYPMFNSTNAGKYSTGGNPGSAANKQEAGAYGAQIGKLVAEERGQANSAFKQSFE